MPSRIFNVVLATSLAGLSSFVSAYSLRTPAKIVSNPTTQPIQKWSEVAPGITPCCMNNLAVFDTDQKLDQWFGPDDPDFQSRLYEICFSGDYVLRPSSDGSQWIVYVGDERESKSPTTQPTDSKDSEIKFQFPKGITPCLPLTPTKPYQTGTDDEPAMTPEAIDAEVFQQVSDSLNITVREFLPLPTAPRDSSIQIGKFGKSDIWYVDFDAVDQTKKTRFEVQVGVGTETGYTPTSQPSSTPEMSHHCTTPAPKFLGRDSLVYDPERNLFRILIPHSSEFDNAVKSFDLLRYPGFLKDDGSSKKRDEGESDEESSKGKVIFGRL